MKIPKDRVLLFLRNLAVLCALWPSAASSAEIWGEADLFDGTAVGQVILVGDIEMGDAEIFRRALEDGVSKGITVWGVKLFSPGGRVREALEIGRIIRQNRLATTAPNEKTVEMLRDKDWGSCYTADFFDLKVKNIHHLKASSENCVCASACALAWLGGVRREGDVALHHPYLASSAAEEQTFDEIEKALHGARHQIENYLREVRAPGWIFDWMVSKS